MFLFTVLYHSSSPCSSYLILLDSYKTLHILLLLQTLLPLFYFKTSVLLHSSKYLHTKGYFITEIEYIQTVRSYNITFLIPLRNMILFYLLYQILPVVIDNIVIHKMSCTYTRTPSHKPNGKSIQNRGKHAHAHNKWSSKNWMILSSFAFLLYLDWTS